MLQTRCWFLLFGCLMALPATPGWAATATETNAPDARQKAIVLIEAFTAQG